MRGITSSDEEGLGRRTPPNCWYPYDVDTPGRTGNGTPARGRFNFSKTVVLPRLRHAIALEHAVARQLADADEPVAAWTADPVPLLGEERQDELPRAPLGHPHHRFVAVLGGQGGDGRRQKSQDQWKEGEEEHAEAELPP